MPKSAGTSSRARIAVLSRPMRRSAQRMPTIHAEPRNSCAANESLAMDPVSRRAGLRGANPLQQPGDAVMHRGRVRLLQLQEGKQVQRHEAMELPHGEPEG